MSLWNGLDTIGIISHGSYTETYGSTSMANICNLYASLGFLEDAPNLLTKIASIVMYYARRRRE